MVEGAGAECGRGAFVRAVLSGTSADCADEGNDQGGRSSGRVNPKGEVKWMRGQKAIGTGEGSAAGIGFAVARYLLEAGAQVAITSTTERIQERARELDANGNNVLAIVADLTEEAAATRIVDTVMKRSGRIDVLVNNAGMAQIGCALEGKTVQESSYADWCRQIEITLHTAFFMTRAVLPVMTQRKYGRILNVSSVTGPLVSNRRSGAYGAGKAAMDGMMRAVALETALDGITINRVSPGWISTASSTQVERIAGLPTPIERP